MMGRYSIRFRHAAGHQRGLPVIAIAGAVLLVAAMVVGLTASHPAVTNGTDTAKDMRGQTVTLDPGETPEPAATAKPVASIGASLHVPSVGLDVPLGALNVVDGQITPPGFTSAYWVRNLGVPVSGGATGTVFVVVHSLRGGGVAPGNYLTNVQTQTSRVKDGAIVEVAGVDYTVTGSQLITKTTISLDSSVWANTPNRLLLITCVEHANGSPSTDNLVITATRNS
jgi:hypothetical protein